MMLPEISRALSLLNRPKTGAVVTKISVTDVSLLTCGRLMCCLKPREQGDPRQASRWECPVSAISEGDGKYEINADVCTECGSCADVCPVGAPQAE